MRKQLLLLLEGTQWRLQKCFSLIVGLLCDCEWKWIKTPLIASFCYLYRVDLKDCVKTQPSDYRSLNDLFTRMLKQDARSYLKSDALVLSPVDGSISQLGIIQGDILLQAKGKTYTLYDLLAGDQTSIDLFKNGYFGTFYLSPSDYHRVHMPVSGTVLHTTYVPGFLLSVGARNTERVSQLFTRNERIMTLFKTNIGSLMIIQVGSRFVGHMGTAWESKDTRPDRTQHVSRIDYTDKNYYLSQADEMGYFRLGSTVILLFQQGAMQWEDTLCIEKRLHCGECIGKALPRGLEPLFTP